jgi:UrcA family protein
MTRLKTFIPLVLPLTFALCALQAPAYAAAPTDDTPAKTVRYSDLNLKKSADVARLFGRIKLAAASICSPLAGQDAQRAARFHHCINDSMAKAVAQVDSPLLTERFAAAGQEAILSPLVSRLNR